MPNTVVKLTNAESTWLEAAREDRKLLIKEKDICKDVLFACSFSALLGVISGILAGIAGRNKPLIKEKDI